MSKRATLRSPKKARPSTAAQMGQFDESAVIQEQLHQAQMCISNQEIEIERLKTTVIALNAKASVVDDHKDDVDRHKDRHDEHVSAREGLHVQITETRETVKVQQETHWNYQSELHSTGDQLKADLEAQKRHQDNREVDHRNEKERMSAEHYNKYTDL